MAKEIIMGAEESKAWLAERDKRAADDALIAKSAGRPLTMRDAEHIYEGVFARMKTALDDRDQRIMAAFRRHLDEQNQRMRELLKRIAKLESGR